MQLSWEAIAGIVITAVMLVIAVVHVIQNPDPAREDTEQEYAGRHSLRF